MLRTLIKQTQNYVRQPNRQYARSHRYVANPGIRRQVTAETNVNVTEYDTHYDDDLSKFEGDLTNTSEIYEQYREETAEEKEHVRRNIVRNKYFKGKNPTFLTWGEMEQIRLLNSKDPEEWNDQKLAESFPADAGTIRKILKTKWQPSDGKRISKHDEKVRSNWDAFVKGKFTGMDQRFSEHLEKFSKRNLNPNVNYDSVLKKEMPKPKSTEFVGIITSCRKYEAEPKQISQSDGSVTVQPKLTAKEYAAMKRIKSGKLYKFRPTSSDESVPVRREADVIFENPFGTGIKPQNGSNVEKSTVSVTKFENSEVQLHENDLKQLSVPSIRQHIVIPDRLFKRGATYRLADCYYDDDGEFLYRVPGMTKI